MTDQTIRIPDEAKLLAGFLDNYAFSIGRSGSPQAALAMMRRAVSLDPFDVAHRVNLASVLINVGEDDEAEMLLAAALSRHEKIGPAWQMMGTLKTHRGKLDEAIACFGRSLALAPDSAQAKFDLGAAYLRAGDWGRGLPLYEHRHDTLPRAGALPPGVPWKGEKTGHLVVWGDQGHGDRIMFARFLPWARERAQKITLLTSAATVPLLYGYRDMLGGDVACAYSPDTPFDHQVALASLPLLYGATPDNLPPDPGLLLPAASTNRLAAAGLKIGLAWAGNPDHPNDNIRSMPFEELLPLSGDSRNDLFSLQCGPPAADIAKARAQRIVGDMSGMIDGEWAHAAAVLQNLDLLVTVDTALAHLAGALGVRTFLLLPLFNDWRWLNGRDDTPWYPSVRLFRQEKPFDWHGLMKRVTAAVARLHQDRSLARMINASIQAASADPHRIGTADEKEPDVAAVLRKVLRPGDLFVDVGANVGMHTRLGAELVGEGGKVLACEPGPNNLPALREATAALPQVEIIEAPLWCVSGEEVTFHLCAEGGGGNALWDPGDYPSNARSREKPESVKLTTTTLDRVIAGRPGNALNPRLIKIDTEGADQRVLEGARSLLKALHPPFIVAELHEFGLNKLGCSQGSLRKLMRDAGYATFVLFADGSKPRLAPPDQVIKSEYIINLLFSTQADVDALWPQEPLTENRPMFGYKPAPAPAAKSPRNLTEAVQAGLANGAAAPIGIKLSNKEADHEHASNGHR